MKTYNIPASLMNTSVSDIFMHSSQEAFFALCKEYKTFCPALQEITETFAEPGY